MVARTVLPARVWLAEAAVAALLAGCASTPQPDPMQVKLDDVDQRLGRVERVVNNQSLLELSQRIDALEAQSRALRGNVEELQNGSQTLSRQQRDLYADLNQRVASLESALKAASASVALAATAGATAGSAAGAAAGAAAGGPAAAGDQAAYGRAFDALKAADYPSAIAQFRDFLKSYPHSALADNAQYWLGEAYYVTRDFDSAASAFRAVGEEYPQSRKASDALLKLGFTQFEQKRLADARSTLGLVVQRYPGSQAAQLASERLQKIAADTSSPADTPPPAAPR
jgi:tol-pal system protein YbgF